jgi:hypothetical protein
MLSAIGFDWLAWFPEAAADAAAEVGATAAGAATGVPLLFLGSSSKRAPLMAPKKVDTALVDSGDFSWLMVALWVVQKLQFICNE